ncbi:MAG: PPOX class F420-dependent oxidoreductase [Actinomycetota bacterium]|nr:PPOX class F420-dependent oxidoreductase [Actinomycetota bacterium]
MDVDEARSFLREHHRAVLATSRSDGRPQMSPVMAAVDDEGYVVISSREPAFKVVNLRRDPRASLVAFTIDFYGGWVQVDGPAHLVSLPEAMDHLIHYYQAVSGEHPDWDEYRQAMEDQRRVVIRIAIEHAGPDRHR